MSRRVEIILSGVGGQGLVTMGSLLGEAALREGLQATLSSTYGTEARGTFTKSDVIVSSGEIDFFEAERPAVVLCLAQVAYDRYCKALGSEALLIYDSDVVTASGEGQARERPFSLSALADQGGAGMAALGLVGALSRAVAEDSLAAVIAQRTTPAGPLRKGSEEAFRKGFAAGLH